MIIDINYFVTNYSALPQKDCILHLRAFFNVFQFLQPQQKHEKLKFWFTSFSILLLKIGKTLKNGEILCQKAS